MLCSSVMRGERILSSIDGRFSLRYLIVLSTFEFDGDMKITGDDVGDAEIEGNDVGGTTGLLNARKSKMKAIHEVS